MPKIVLADQLLKEGISQAHVTELLGASRRTGIRGHKHLILWLL